MGVYQFNRLGQPEKLTSNPLNNGMPHHVDKHVKQVTFFLIALFYSSRFKLRRRTSSSVCALSPSSVLPCAVGWRVSGSTLTKTTSSAKQMVFLVALLRTKQLTVMDVLPTAFVSNPNSTISFLSFSKGNKKF